jgi:hypothetical protein
VRDNPGPDSDRSHDSRPAIGRGQAELAPQQLSGAKAAFGSDGEVTGPGNGMGRCRLDLEIGAGLAPARRRDDSGPC